MESGVVVEGNHQKSDSTPMSRPSGTLIRIDAISIDLAGDMENHNEGSKCEHFSIRGYADEMRKKDISICLPFAFDCNQNNLEDLHVTKFKWWRCQNCQQEISATSSLEEIEIVSDRCASGFVSGSACSQLQSPIDESMMPSDSQHAPELDNFARWKSDIKFSTDVNRDGILLSSCGHGKEKKDEFGQAAVTGHNDAAGTDVNEEICNPICDISESNPCLVQKRQGAGSDTLGPSCRSYAAANIKNPDCIGNICAKVCQTGTLSSADGEQRIESVACETPEILGRTNEGLNVVKRQMATLPSPGQQKHDNLSSESGHHDQNLDNSSGLTRQKTRKMRLLTELLHSKGIAESDQIRTDSASNVVPIISAGLDSVSVLHGHMAVQGSLKKHFGGPKGKRKMSQDKDWKRPELNCPNKLTKKARVFKGDAEISNVNTVIAGSESEEDASARVGLQASVTNQWTQRGIMRNPVLRKKKNLQTGIEGGYSPLMPQQEVTNRFKIGDAEKHFAASDGGFSKSAHDVFIKSGMEPYFIRSLSLQQAEQKSSFCKKKNKQVGVGQASLMPQRNSILGEGSILRKDIDIMETERERVELQSAHDINARRGLDLSLNSYVFAPRNEKSTSAQIGDEIDPLFPQHKGTQREDHNQRKNIMLVGESSIPRKSAPDLLSRKGLMCDLNEKIAGHRTSPLCDMQNLVPQVENGSFASHQRLDFSGTLNNENTIEVQEQGNDDIPMEIVELLARNQYERCCHEPERNYFISEQDNEKRNTGLMSFPSVNGNGMLKSLQEESYRMRKPLSGLGMVSTGENVRSVKRNLTNGFSEIRGNHFNMGQLEGNSAFTGFSAFSNCQEMQSGGVQTSDSSSIRNSNPQTFKWKGDKMASRFSPTKVPVVEVCNSSQNGSRLSEGDHIRPPLPNHMPFGLNIPQRYGAQSSNVEMHSQFRETLCEGRMIGNLDFNFMDVNTNSIQKQNRNFDSESFRRASAENPFVRKHNEIDLNAEASGSLDLHSNETIPAMQLLSLMDAGMQSSSTFSLDGNTKFFTKPFFPCDHHPKASLDGTSRIFEKSLFPYDPHPKAFSGLGTGVYNDRSRHPSSTFYGQVSSKSEERGKAFMQNRGRRLQKSVCTSGISRTTSDSNPIHDKQKGFSGASTSMMFPFQRHTIQDSTKCIDLEASCSVNRNPADFSIPEAGNVYMINGRDLKFGKKISSKGRPPLINVDGQKRQRVTKLTAMKGHAQHPSS